MKNIIYKVVITAALLQILISALIAQNNTLHYKNEHLVLFTDRTLYVTGENISFSANLYASNDNESKGISKILYVELVTPKGESMVGEKYKLTESFCTGNISIPSNILTGFYYVKTYTKLMRNAGPTAYHYTRLKIINPYSDKIIDYNPVKNTENQTVKIENSTFEITTDKSTYSNREQAKIEISSKLKENNFEKINLAVIPADSYFHQKVLVHETSTPTSNDFFYPETKGISIVGQVIDDKTGKGIPYAVVNLSIIGKNKDFIARLSDSAGNFLIALPDLTGRRNIFLSSQIKTNLSPRIQVFNDFCSKEISIETPEFKLSEEEKEIAYKFAVNKEIVSLFPKDSMGQNEAVKLYNNPFYGEPSEILNPGEFIELPTLEECFIELPSHVRILRKKDEKYFKIWGGQSGLSVYGPLILVDMVAITDYKKVLSISPEVISHIETVTKPYVKGIMTYGGIISIFSKDGNYCGIKLPETGIFLDYQFLANSPKINQKATIPISQPDVKNTLAWFPDITLDKDNSAIASFQTSDSNGKYLIVVRSITNKGEIVTHTGYFEVE